MKLRAGQRLKVVNADAFALNGKKRRPPFAEGDIVTLARAVEASGPDSAVYLTEHRGGWKWLRFVATGA